MKNGLYIFFILNCLTLGAQQYEPGTVTKSNRAPYFRKEEIIYDQKRYRIHNNYLTFGPGLLSSSIRERSQQSINIDLQFHIRRQHFQAGVLMSGESFGANNHVQAHLGYGYRKETRNYNLAFFGGPTWSTGALVYEDSVLGTIPLIYEGFGFYGCAQAVYKFKFDIGVGVEAFGEYSAQQTMYGFRLIFFFSSAYVGLKRNYNPNVRPHREKK